MPMASVVSSLDERGLDLLKVHLLCDMVIQAASMPSAAMLNTFAVMYSKEDPAVFYLIKLHNRINELTKTIDKMNTHI